MLIKRIVFDLDNTLIDWKEEYWNAINNTFTELKLKYTENDVEKIKQSIDVYENEQNYTYNKEAMKHTMEKALGYKLPDNFIDIWQNQLSSCVPDKIDKSIIQTLTYLRTKYDLAILSNWLKESQINRLKKTGLYYLFTDIYITEGIPMKPNKKAFEIAKGRFKEKECVMVGDNFKVDIEGAINAGMRAIYLNRAKEKTEYTNTIYNISELMQIL